MAENSTSTTATSLSVIEDFIAQEKIRDAIVSLVELIDFLQGYRDPLDNLKGRYVSIKSGSATEETYEISKVEESRTRSKLLMSLSEIREEINKKISIFKPIPFKDAERDVLKNFISTELSKKFVDVNCFDASSKSFFYFKAKEKYTKQDVMIMVLQSSNREDLIGDTKLDQIGQLKHRNLIQVLEVNFETYPYYMVTEFVEGIRLKDLLKIMRRIPMHSTKRILFKIGDVLDTLRQKKFPMVGLRPSKIMLDNELEPEISAFDLLKTNDKRRLFESYIEDCYYFAPERLYNLFSKAENPPHRPLLSAMDKANQFCLAALGYELITGEKLFDKDDFDEVKIPLKDIEQLKKLQKKQKAKAAKSKLESNQVNNAPQTLAEEEVVIKEKPDDILRRRYLFFKSQELKHEAMESGKKADFVYYCDHRLNKITEKDWREVFGKMLMFAPADRFSNMTEAMTRIDKLDSDKDKLAKRVYDSYRRCLNHPDDFVETFLDDVLKNDDLDDLHYSDDELNLKTDILEAKREALKTRFHRSIHLIFDPNNINESLSNMFSHSSKLPFDRPDPTEFKAFFNVFIQTVEKCDPQYDKNKDVREAWDKVRKEIDEYLEGEIAAEKARKFSENEAEAPPQ